MLKTEAVVHELKTIPENENENEQKQLTFMQADIQMK